MELNDFHVELWARLGEGVQSDAKHETSFNRCGKSLEYLFYKELLVNIAKLKIFFSSFMTFFVASDVNLIFFHLHLQKIFLLFNKNLITLYNTQLR